MEWGNSGALVTGSVLRAAPTTLPAGRAASSAWLRSLTQVCFLAVNELLDILMAYWLRIQSN